MIDEISEKFPQISFTYGLDSITGQHLVEVEPDTEYRNEEYMFAEFEFIDSFINKYPTEQIVFISNDNYIKIEKPLYIKEGLIKVPDNLITYSPVISSHGLIHSPINMEGFILSPFINNVKVYPDFIQNDLNGDILITATRAILNSGESNYALAA